MTDDIRASLARLKEIPTASLDAANGELTTLLTGLRKEIEVPQWRALRPGRDPHGVQRGRRRLDDVAATGQRRHSDEGRTGQIGDCRHQGDPAFVEESSIGHQLNDAQRPRYRRAQPGPKDRPRPGVVTLGLMPCRI